MALTTEQLKRLTLDEMNSGLKCYREDLRYTREDAVNFVKLWNENKSATHATIISEGAFPHIVVLDGWD